MFVSVVVAMGREEEGDECDFEPFQSFAKAHAA
jgi:hypothetical protein